ncbi:CBS domain [Macleaya cordata]|uniref:CBS domain n=1 Tax=Macleaya cordata TaxID=56857 RepID=A0A200R2K7_MACCD|nr:CBS domain [Macleaya cordata]
MAGTEEPCCKPMFWIYLLICVALVIFAGLMSGLTLGLMSLSQVDLEVLVKAGQPQDRKNAAKILPIVKNQHLLLCTLLIGNALAMEALPIFLDALVPAWGAILISVTLILAFGEIIPQAVCSHYGLSVGAKMAVVVRLLLMVFFPISYPISKLLDWILGKGHFALLRRAELKTLVDMHGNEAGKGGELTHDETTIITGALDLTQKTAKDAMTPISETFSLDINSKLDVHTMGLIMRKGHSRVPVYSGSPTNIVGLILVKNLIFCHPEDEIPIRNATIRKIPRVSDHLPLYEILNEFQKGHSHMAVVVKSMKDVIATPESTNGKTNMTRARKKSKVKESQQEEKGTDFHSVMVVTSSPNVHSGDIETQSPMIRNNIEQCKDIHPQLKKREGGGHDDIVDVVLDSVSSYSKDQEVIGIITMEDVIEELLQEEIFDETDEYIDVHNKIKINMIPPRKSSPNSPSAVSLYHFQKRTPLASPLSPYHHTSILHSPVSPYTQSQVPRPSLSSSPGKSLTASPGEFMSPGRNSPASRPEEFKGRN